MAFADRILGLLRRHGEVVTVRHVAAAYDPATGKGSGSPTTTDVVTIGVRRGFRHDQVDGVTIQRSDEQLAIQNDALLTFEPKKGDSVITGTQKWNVQNTRAYRRDGIVVAFDLHIRAS